MTQGEILTQYFAQIWRLFSVQSPWFGLSFAKILFGIFVVSISIVCLRTLLPFIGLPVSNWYKDYDRKGD